MRHSASAGCSSIPKMINPYTPNAAIWLKKHISATSEEASSRSPARAGSSRSHSAAPQSATPSPNR